VRNLNSNWSIGSKFVCLYAVVAWEFVILSFSTKRYYANGFGGGGK
jgi:hypothetical protein